MSTGWSSSSRDLMGESWTSKAIHLAFERWKSAIAIFWSMATSALDGRYTHEGSPWEGLAETPGTMLHDYDDMKALQVTLTRPVHYPQPSFILDYADRHGILLIRKSRCGNSVKRR